MSFDFKFNFEHYKQKIAKMLEADVVGKAITEAIALGRLLAIIEHGSTPIPMRLLCPECGQLHIDEGEFATKPHHTHACQHCGHVWRPALVCTAGVRFLPGFKNEAPPP